MNNIVDYKIISAQGTSALNDEIKKSIKEGWQPLGSHQVVTIIDPSSGRGVLLYSQSVVKYSA